MRALVVDPEVRARLRLTDVSEPNPEPRQLLMEVRRSSLNAAEVFFAQRSEPGTVLGFDAAGVVVSPAADGSGRHRVHASSPLPPGAGGPNAA